MRYKRMISLFLTFVMALGALSGCGSDPESAAAPEEPVAVLDIGEMQKEELLDMSKLGFSLNHSKENSDAWLSKPSIAIILLHFRMASICRQYSHVILSEVTRRGIPKRVLFLC